MARGAQTTNSRHQSRNVFTKDLRPSRGGNFALRYPPKLLAFRSPRALLDRRDALLVVGDLSTHRAILAQQVTHLAHGTGDAHQLRGQTDLAGSLALLEAVE